MALEYRLAKLVHFALHQYVGAGAFEGKVETADAGEERIVVNRNVRGNGLIFRTQDPKVALKNVLTER